MKCLITNIETNNKWKGRPICNEMMAEAKKLMLDKEISMRDALIFLQDAWSKQFKQKALDKANSELRKKSDAKFKLAMVKTDE